MTNNTKTASALTVGDTIAIRSGFARSTAEVLEVKALGEHMTRVLTLERTEGREVRNAIHAPNEYPFDIR